MRTSRPGVVEADHPTANEPAAAMPVVVLACALSGSSSRAQARIVAPIHDPPVEEEMRWSACGCWAWIGTSALDPLGATGRSGEWR